MIIKIATFGGNIYLTRAIELVNDEKDLRLLDLDGDYVLIQADQVQYIVLV